MYWWQWGCGGGGGGGGRGGGGITPALVTTLFENHLLPNFPFSHFRYPKPHYASRGGSTHATINHVHYKSLPTFAGG